MARPITIFLLFMLAGTMQAQKLIAIDDFSAHLSEFKLLGNAQITEAHLHVSPDQPNSKGAAWYGAQKIDLSRGFETEFQFIITSEGSANPKGDGFAFVIQNNGLDAIGDGGKSLAYNGINKSVVIEFDTYNDGEGSQNHIEISYRGREDKINQKLATVHSIPEISDGAPHFARLHYKDGQLILYLDSYIFPVLSSKIDIENIVEANDSLAWIGFTAASSDAQALHKIISWQFEYYLAPPEIEEDKIAVNYAAKIPVKNRKFKLLISDYNKIDGDIVSLKYGNRWILTEHKLTKEPYAVELTLTGFKQDLIMFANNVGSIPPNTARITIDDGIEPFSLQLKSDLRTSEAIEIRYAQE